LGPDTEVDFTVVAGAIVLKKRAQKLNLDRWEGYCANPLKELGYSSVDEFIEDVQGL
jgi:hypothetical protein